MGVEGSCICWFTPQMPIIARTNLKQTSQNSGQVFHTRGQPSESSPATDSQCPYQDAPGSGITAGDSGHKSSSQPGQMPTLLSACLTGELWVGVWIDELINKEADNWKDEPSNMHMCVHVFVRV